LFLLFSPLLLTVSGCSGCNKDPATQQEEEEKAEAERKKKEAEKPKPNFESRGLGTLPPNRLMSSSHCKPGHWTSAVLSDTKANNFDFLGDMEIEVLNGENRPQPLFATPFELTTSRQITLSKGQSKTLDSVFFVPQNAQKTTVASNVTARGGGRTAIPGQMLASRMPSYQYHFLVLARTPELYGYIDAELRQNSDRDSNRFFCIRPYRHAESVTEVNPYYKVSYLESGKRVMLPAHAMLWTSIAVVLWDDADPSAFDAAQQRAMLDWLHWGGQLILSGPGTLDALKGSFLEPYLPAVAVGTREIPNAELAEINAFSGKQMRQLAPVKTWTGVKFDKHPQAEFMPHSGELLVERRVGRGRIVVSAFRLSDRALTTWPGLDEFFNAFLLRHPPRKFLDIQQDDQLRAVWSDAHKTKNWDAAEITNLRYFARDEGIQLADYAPDRPKYQPTVEETDSYPYRMPSTPEPVDLNASTTISAPGVAAWNDFSPAAREARKSLNTAARIEVPDRTFVVTLLAVYLGVLVPLNWCFFRAIGRVEWAWAAAPIIAVLCTVAVIKLAQLDIGFVRSRNEIAVLEIQPDYPRAHLTRYNALYTSLSTPYDFTFTDGGAAVLPFPTVSDPDKFTMVAGQERHGIRYVTGEQAILQDVPVSSNSTMLMHSEETFDLGGKLELKPNPLGGLRLANGTKLNLQGIALLKKDSSGNLQTAWIRAIEPGGEKDVDWVRSSGTTTGKRLWAEFREKDPLTVTRSETKSGELNLRELVNLAEKNEDMRPGEIKLVAWTDEELPGLTIAPHSAQSRHAAVVVAHLSYGEEPLLRPDVNRPDTPEKVKYYTD
jgi:hypothetical protein